VADRLTKASGWSQHQARWDICRAVSDGVIGIHAVLKRHATSGQRSNSVVGADHLEIPNLKPEDFDWEQSRPMKPWRLRELARHHPGLWHMERIELSRSDATAELLSNLKPRALSPSASDKQPMPKSRQTPKLDSAKIAVKTLWPDGPPPPHELPNTLLDRQVNSWLKQNRMVEVSQETVLRAAGRR